jgi:hypothetical protein
LQIRGEKNGYMVSIFSIRLDTKYPQHHPLTWRELKSLRNEGNAADGRFPTASSVENKERKPGIEPGCKDSKLIGIDQYSHKNKE